MRLAITAALLLVTAAVALAAPGWWQTTTGCSTTTNVGQVNDCLPYPLLTPIPTSAKLRPASCPSSVFYPQRDNTYEHRLHWHCEPPKVR